MASFGFQIGFEIGFVPGLVKVTTPDGKNPRRCRGLTGNEATRSVASINP
jgi:hypothetical protein